MKKGSISQNKHTGTTNRMTNNVNYMSEKTSVPSQKSNVQNQCVLSARSNKSSKTSANSGYYSMQPSARERIENKHIFMKSYNTFCQLNNTVPKIKVGPNLMLEFYADRIRCEDWPPIIKAIATDRTLKSIRICSYNLSHEGLVNNPPINRRKTIHALLMSLQECLASSKALTDLYIEALPFSKSDLLVLFKAELPIVIIISPPQSIREGLMLMDSFIERSFHSWNNGLENNSSLQHFAIPHCTLGDKGCESLSQTIRYKTNIVTIDLSACGISRDGAEHIAEIIKIHKLARYGLCWEQSLRYRKPNPTVSQGLREIIFDNNSELCDFGFSVLAEVLMDDVWMSGIYCKNCGLTDVGAEKAIKLAQTNPFLINIDIRKNIKVDPELVKKLESIVINNHSSVPIGQSCSSVISEQSNRLPVPKCENYYSSNNICAGFSNMSSKFSIPPLKISSLRRNMVPAKNITSKDKKLSEIEKMRKALEEMKVMLQVETAQRFTLERHCEHLEEQLREKSALFSLVDAFQEMAVAFKHIKKIGWNQYLENERLENLKDQCTSSSDNITGNENPDKLRNIRKIKSIAEKYTQTENASLSSKESQITDPTLRARQLYKKLLKLSDTE